MTQGHPELFGVALFCMSVSNKNSKPSVLYSCHKESGLIRISLSIRFGGPGWSWGCTWTEKSERPGTVSLLKYRICPFSPFPDTQLASGFFFSSLTSSSMKIFWLSDRINADLPLQKFMEL